MFPLALKYRTDVSAAYSGLALRVIGRREPTGRVAILVNREDGPSVPASNVASAMHIPSAVAWAILQYKLKFALFLFG